MSETYEVQRVYRAYPGWAPRYLETNDGERCLVLERNERRIAVRLLDREVVKREPNKEWLRLNALQRIESVKLWG